MTKLLISLIPLPFLLLVSCNNEQSDKKASEVIKAEIEQKTSKKNVIDPIVGVYYSPDYNDTLTFLISSLPEGSSKDISIYGGKDIYTFSKDGNITFRYSEDYFIGCANGLYVVEEGAWEKLSKNKYSITLWAKSMDENMSKQVIDVALEVDKQNQKKLSIIEIVDFDLVFYHDLKQEDYYKNDKPLSVKEFFEKNK